MIEFNRFNPDVFAGKDGPLDQQQGIYLITNIDYTQTFYVGESVDLRRRIRSQLCWHAPSTLDAKLNQISGINKLVAELYFGSGLMRGRVRELVMPVQSAFRSTLRVATIHGERFSFENQRWRLETDLINYLKPPHNGSPKLGRRHWKLDELDDRVDPLLDQLADAGEQNVSSVNDCPHRSGQ